MEASYDSQYKVLRLRGSSLKKIKESLYELANMNPDARISLSGISINDCVCSDKVLELVLRWLNNPSSISWVIFTLSYVNSKTLNLLPSKTKIVMFDESETSIENFSALENKKNVSILSLRKVNSLALGSLMRLPPLSQIDTISIIDCILDRIAIQSSPTCEYLQEFPKLRKLRLEKCRLVSEDLVHISNCHSLTHLNLSHNRGIGNEVHNLFQMMKVQRLKLKNCEIQDDDLSCLYLAKDLISIDLRQNPEIGEYGIESIAALDTLQMLRLSNISVSAMSLSKLIKNGNLTHLQLKECKLPENFGKVISGSFLRVLNVSGSDLTDSKLECISECCTLKELSVRKTQAAKTQGKYLSSLINNPAITIFN